MKITTLEYPDQIFPLFTKYRKSTSFKFRGQSNSEWRLVPKAGRETLKDQDDQLLFKHWKRRAIAFLKKDNLNNWELLAIANHYGVPTRLLDWSQNPLIATLFCCMENFEKDGAVFICHPVKYADTVKLEPFNVEQDRVLFIQPNASSFRIINQLGYFSIHNKPSLELSEESGKVPIEKVIIPKIFKKEIVFILNQFGINNLLIYPDLDGLSKHLIWFYENYEYWDGTFPKNDTK
jgi:hypothetical protein